ncbi:hypothetical protein M0811_11890 [Anaeramoeba ignava]|uniref:Fluoroacetyl-CoA-specific thioesterase-like domain-containing protein n=1 Tax=Anaeramoeba ignava TaxID=1746090 RepID=A0A9Q0R7W4_ANAIG|nr:hypothetical protein M0811_11890 [Anaeramoeba ignava]|eukprot:Anaeramoba_ignava/a351983_33.p1 GENE.a351983_33~~a351983_33.p1  ORF type:complete len:165 (-),score=60.85 a351983_33:54-548(-)
MSIQSKKKLQNSLIPKQILFRTFASKLKPSEEAKRVLKIGGKGVKTTFVSKDLTTNRTGKENDDVLSTPSMILLMELASVEAIDPFLDKSFATVGFHVNVKHLARTNKGATVTTESIIEKIDGSKITLDVKAFEIDGNKKKLIGDGKHRRAVIKFDDDNDKKKN